MVGVDLAPTSRAKCNKCKKIIEEGSIRMSVFTGESSNFSSKYCHMSCYRPKTMAAINSLYRPRGMSDQQKEDYKAFITKWTTFFDKKKAASEAKKNKKKKGTKRKVAEPDEEEEEGEEGEGNSEEKDNKEEEKEGENLNDEPAAKKLKQDLYPNWNVPLEDAIWQKVLLYLPMSQMVKTVGIVTKYFHELTKSDKVWSIIVNNKFMGKERVEKLCGNVGINSGETYIFKYKQLIKSVCFECGKNCKEVMLLAKKVLCEDCKKLPQYGLVTKKNGNKFFKIPEAIIDTLEFWALPNPHGFSAPMKLYLVQTLLEKVEERVNEGIKRQRNVKLIDGNFMVDGRDIGCPITTKVTIVGNSIMIL